VIWLVVVRGRITGSVTTIANSSRDTGFQERKRVRWKMIWGLIKTMVWIFIVAVIIIAASRFFFIDIAEVGHNGMAPTLVVGDVVAVFRGARVDIGDVVICKNPIRKGEFVTGRVIAKAGSTVQTDRQGQLEVDEKSFDVAWRGAMRFYDSVSTRRFNVKLGSTRTGDSEYQIFMEEKNTFSVRPTHVERGVYLLGDNRMPHSYDSRTFGEIDPESCVGRVFFMLQPSNAREPEIKRSRLQNI
jgi:signal peptidase I